MLSECSDHFLCHICTDKPAECNQLRHRRGISETLRVQYIKTKDVRLARKFTDVMYVPI